MASPVLGIDLGTTNSVVAFADETRVRVLRDEEGRLLTPSTVSFPASGEIKVGQAARDLRLIDAQHTVYSVKRLIGRPFRSPEVRQAAKHLPFKLEEGQTGGVVVRVRQETFSLPEISSFILRRVRDIAEAALEQPCQNAVITVPANFNELQRMATRDAGRIAGLNVLRILNEPTAAALAYGYRAQQQQRIAVYDFGGGTFDISILELSGDVIEVVATAGDTHLGGDDLDRAIADRMAAEFRRLHGVDLTHSPESYGRLSLAAEWIKCQLSEREAAEATIKKLALRDGVPLDLKFRLGQREWEELASPLIQRTFHICEDALRLANVRPSQLDAVLLVGGQTRTPRVRELVREFFGLEPKFSVDPDLAVAHGAALQGYALAGVPAAEPDKRVRTLAGGAKPAVDNPFADEPTRVSGPEELADSGRKARRSDNPFEEQANTEKHGNKAKPVQTRLPSLRPERPAVLHAQTLSGVGTDKAKVEAAARASAIQMPRAELEAGALVSAAPGGEAQPEHDADAEDGATSSLLASDAQRERAREGVPASDTASEAQRPGTEVARSSTGPSRHAAAGAGQSAPAGAPRKAAPPPPPPARSRRSGSPAVVPPPAAGAPAIARAETQQTGLPDGQPPSGQPAPAPHGSPARAARGEPIMERLEHVPFGGPRPQPAADSGDETDAWQRMAAEQDALEARAAQEAPSWGSQPAPERAWDADEEDGAPTSAFTAARHALQGSEPARPHPADAAARGSVRAREADAAARDAAARAGANATPIPAEPHPAGAATRGSVLAREADADAPVGAYASPIPARPHPADAAARGSVRAREADADAHDAGARAGAHSASPVARARGADVVPRPRTDAAASSRPRRTDPSAPSDGIGVAFSRWSAAPAGADPIALAHLNVRPANETTDPGSQFPGPPSVAPLLLDVTPHTLCVETVGGFCEPIIERNAPIPTEQTRLFTTSRDHQDAVSVRVCQGESRRTDDNQVLGQVELVGLPPARRGEVSIAVTFMIDADGTLNVRAVDEATGRGQDLRVNLTGAIAPEELERLRLRLRSLAS